MNTEKSILKMLEDLDWQADYIIKTQFQNMVEGMKAGGFETKIQNIRGKYKELEALWIEHLDSVLKGKPKTFGKDTSIGIPVKKG